MNPPTGGWLLASLIYDFIWPLKNKLYTDEVYQAIEFIILINLFISDRKINNYYIILPQTY